MDGLLDDMSSFLDNKLGYDTQKEVDTVDSKNDNLRIFYKKLTDLGINIDELETALEVNENALIVAIAGAGKSTCICLKIIRDLLVGDMMKVVNINNGTGEMQVVVPANILVCTFLKSGALELEKAFKNWCKKLKITGLDFSAIKFKTIDSEVYGAIKSLGVNCNILDTSESKSIVKDVMSMLNVRSVLATSKSIIDEEVTDVMCIMDYARGKLDEGKYSHPLMSDYCIDSFLLDAMLKEYQLRRRGYGKYDFIDLQEMLLEAMNMRPDIVEVIQKRYDYIFMDEFQDTSQLQYEVLKHYFNGSRRVIVVGDDDQCIYSWRGSDIDIIVKRFREDYNPIIANLSTNYRCRKNILNFVAPSIKKNENRFAKELNAFKEGGEVKIIEDGSIDKLMSCLNEDLGKDMKVGILARTNADLLIPALLLELGNTVNFSVSKSVSLNNRIARQVLGVIDLITKRYNSDFQSHLKLFLAKYNQFEAKKLCDILKSNKTESIYTIPKRDLEYSVPNLAHIIIPLRKAKELGDVEAYLFLLDILKRDVYCGKSVYADKARLFVTFIRKLILEHDSVKGLNIHQIDDLFNNVLPERLDRRIKYGKDNFVKLTTVHEAKGKEWNSVYIWNDIEGCFPNKVGNREITKAEHEEERRVHYIACTRPIDKLTIFTSASSKGYFLKECDSSYIGVTLSSENETPIPLKAKKKVELDSDVALKLRVENIVKGTIENILSSGNLADIRVANLEIVMNEFSVGYIVDKLLTEYISESDTDDTIVTLLDDVVSRLADELLSQG